MSVVHIPIMSTRRSVMPDLLQCFRRQQASLNAAQATLTRTKAAIDRALGQESVCVVAGLGEVRRIPMSETVTWNTKKLNVVQAALLLIGEDKLAADIGAARTIIVQDNAIHITLFGDADDGVR